MEDSKEQARSYCQTARKINEAFKCPTGSDSALKECKRGERTICLPTMSTLWLVLKTPLTAGLEIQVLKFKRCVQDFYEINVIYTKRHSQWCFLSSLTFTSLFPLNGFSGSSATSKISGFQKRILLKLQWIIKYMKQGLICNSRLLGHWAEIKENGSLIIRLKDGKDSLKRSIFLWNLSDSYLVKMKWRASLGFGGSWAYLENKALFDTVVISTWFVKFYNSTCNWYYP